MLDVKLLNPCKHVNIHVNQNSFTGPLIIEKWVPGLERER